MAATGSNAQSAGVLLVDAENLLLQGDNEEDSTDVTADLLQQALQGASAINASDNTSHDHEVKFDALHENSSEVVAIFQGNSGETHTIKMTREQLESLGLHLENKTTCDPSVTSAVANVVSGAATPTPAPNLIAPHENILPLVQDNLLSTLPSMVSEGRMIDEEGNIVQADDMQMLPNSLSSYLDQDVSQAITIVPQYGIDGMVTYAVKLKDASGLTTSDYTLSNANIVASKEEEPKTGLDIEVEMARVNAKKALSSLEEAMAPVAIPMSSSVTVPISSAVSMPNLPLTATIPRVNHGNKFMPVVPSAASTPVQNSYFRILPERSAMNIGAIASTVRPSVDMQPIQNNITNIVSDSLVRPVMNKLQSSIGFPITASSLNTTSPGRTFSVGANSQLGLNVYSIVNPSNVISTTSANTFRTVTSNGITMKPPTRPAPSRVPTLQTTTSRLLPISTAKVTSVNVIPSQPAMIMTSATTTQPAIGAAAITKVCQPMTAAGSRAPNILNTKPLGSSENPIQLVQQGQTFHSMQALSQSQLHQIATVLQQKHIGGLPKKNVVFDEQTKTRIVYRVVYPEDVDLQQPNSPIDGRDASAFRTATVPPAKPKTRGRGRPAKNSRTYQQPSQAESQNVDGDDEDKTPEDAAKGDRKKVVARTRSGRLSRPPRHMLKDYKRLHNLDFWEPYVDDSDGGYSDYVTADSATAQTANATGEVATNGVMANVSTTVPVEESAVNKENELLKGLIPVKRRVSSRFSCPTCQKIYLGYSRMARHLQRFPDHGSIEEFKKLRREENKPEGSGDNASKQAVGDLKRRGARGRKRSHWAQRTPQERSEQRKNKLRQMIATCEPQELVEVVGPLIARTLTLWDLLLLRLESLDRPSAKLKPGDTDSSTGTHPEVGNNEGDDTEMRERANSNRVAWLLIELRSLLDSVQSIAGDLLKPQGVSDSSVENVVEIAEQALSNMLGMACGTYIANDQLLRPQREEEVTSQAKRPRMDDDRELAVSGVPDTDECSAVLPDVEMVSKDDTSKSLSPMKLTDDMPFLNSSDDMICEGDDPDASTDDKRCDHDTDSAAGLQAVDDIVNERLKNLEENMSFSVSLPSQLETPMSNPSADLLMTDFTDGPSLSVNNTSVITNVRDTGASVGVPSMDLLNTYDSSISSLTGTVPITGDVTISNSPSTGDLASSLTSETNQEMLSSYSMALSSLMSIPSALQGGTTSSVSHSADSFLDSLTSFEAPSCGDTDVSYGDSVLKDEPVLPISSNPPQRRQSPPKFISTFTPAQTDDKPSEPITTAQRLQRDYRFSERSMGLELDSGLDVGLDTDLDFEALTEELNRNTR